jgi:hypothetical protein
MKILPEEDAGIDLPRYVEKRESRSSDRESLWQSNTPQPSV